MMLDGILTVVDSKHIVGQLQEDSKSAVFFSSFEQLDDLNKLNTHKLLQEI